ncbi:MAG TPA: hypothetical protein VJ836_05430 [Candidatus Saccharimonadales bacterium]|nr:hypothetical protein [Candidatus Saccharimonadales bacterium]
MSEESPLSAQPAIEAFRPSAADIAPQQAELNQRGTELVRLLSGALPELVEKGIMIETTSPQDRAKGQLRFKSTTSDNIAGGWRKVADSKALRMEVLCPGEGVVKQSGFVNVEGADLKSIGATTIPNRPRTVRVNIDHDGVSHVSGVEGGVKFSVDKPNPNSFFEDLVAANRVLNEAGIGVEQIISDAAPPPVLPVQ